MATISFAFKCIESHIQVEDVIDLIANKLHRIHFNNGIKESIETRTSVFEKIFFECKGNRMNSIFEKYPNTLVHIDEYYDWNTVIFQLTKTHFVMFHDYLEDRSHYILVEGDIFPNNEINIERFYYSSGNIYNSFNDYASGGYNHIPFQYLCDVINPGISYNYGKLTKQTTIKKWFKPLDICNSLANEFIDMIKNELVELIE